MNQNEAQGVPLGGWAAAGVEHYLELYFEFDCETVAKVEVCFETTKKEQ